MALVITGIEIFWSISDLVTQKGTHPFAPITSTLWLDAKYDTSFSFMWFLEILHPVNNLQDGI